jgi:hypothetical protein
MWSSCWSCSQSIWFMFCLNYVGSSWWSYSRYIWCMCCLNFYWVRFLVLLPIYLVDVLSKLVLGPVPGFILIIFGGCGPVSGLTSAIFGWCVVWTFVWSSSWFYSRYICWMYCLNFYRVHLLVLLLLYLVDVLFELCRVQFLVFSRYIWWICFLNICRVQFLVLLLLYLVDVLSERL